MTTAHYWMVATVRAMRKKFSSDGSNSGEKKHKLSGDGVCAGL
jgi:hypothetical protein